jgi:hypothetical protein
VKENSISYKTAKQESERLICEKIRDDFDLKELENFGFEYEEDGEKYWCKYLPDNQHKLFIYEDDREIKQGRFTLIYGYCEVELEEKWIQDLIKADLVVKKRY